MTNASHRDDDGFLTAEEPDLGAAEADIASSESVPLLASARGPKKATPLPLRQLLILAAVRIAEPIAFTQIFPYINQMIEDLGTDPADVGYYSGMVDSTFQIAQLFTIYLWTSLSDRIGRKPVLLMGLTGAALCSGCFGFSRSLPAMLTVRFLAGALTGNVAVVSSMLSEITDETNQGKAFPLMGATWNFGSIIGPMLGGTLSKPASRWPGTFGRYPIFLKYPYMLPCVISSSISAFSIVLCALFVNETHPRIIAAKKRASELQKLGSAPLDDSYGSGSTTPAALKSTKGNQSSRDEEGTKKASVKNLFSQPHIRSVMGAAFLVSFLAVAWEVVFVLYSYTQVNLGGMGRSPSQIGYALAISGAAGTVSALLFFPYIQRRFNNRRLYAFFTAFYIIVFCFMPLGNIAARLPMGEDAKKQESVLWAAIIAILVPIRLAANANILTLIMVKASADAPEQLSSMYGLQQSCSAIARGVAPSFASSLFALSIERQLLGGKFVWVVFVALSAAAVPLTLSVRDVPAPGVHPK